MDLVYGGGSIGLMGLVSQAVHRAGGNVLGYSIISKLLSLLCSILLFGILFICLTGLIFVHRIIPRTLMSKEVYNLIWDFLMLFWVVSSFHFCGLKFSFLASLCLKKVCVCIFIYIYLCGATDYWRDCWRGKACGRHAPKKGRNGPPF